MDHIIFFPLQNYSTVYKFGVFKIFVVVVFELFFLYDNKAEFSASLLQSSVSHDPSEIILTCSFAAQKNFLLLSMFKTVVLLNIIVETLIIVFRTLWWIESAIYVQ